MQEIDPVESLLLTGSVESWKEQDISAEVGGVVRYVVEPGTDLEGRWEEDGEVKVEGDVLARIDPREFEIAEARAAASVEVTKEQLHTANLELSQVLPANLKAAQADQERSQAEYDRYVQASRTNAVAELDVIRAKAERDGQAARYAQALAAIETKKAEIKSLEASVGEAEQALRQANYDLERCEVFAPFTCQVSEVFIEAGGFANRSQAIAHLVMMNPIKVDLAVSSDMAQQMRRGDAVRIYLAGGARTLRGRVYDKATAADPETRAFRVSVITGNQRLADPFDEGDPRRELPRIEQFMTVLEVETPSGSMKAVEARRALRQDAGGYFIWVDRRYSVGDSVPDGTVLELHKARVTPGERRISLQGIYLMRELTDVGELQDGVVVGLDVPDAFEDGGKVMVARPQWTLRPGQLVSVLLSGRAPKPGLYLPMKAILPIDDSHGAVFVVEADGDAHVARRIEIPLADQVAGYWPVQSEHLQPGAKVIIDYLHFLQDGEPVSVTKSTGIRQ